MKRNRQDWNENESLEQRWQKWKDHRRAWRSKRGGLYGEHAPMMAPGFHRRRRSMFMRFLGFLLFLVLPLVGLGILFGTLIAGAESAPPRLTFFIGVICCIPILMVIVVVTVGSLAFRSLGAPLANIMAAADAVAEGDLSTRVADKGSSEFRRLARSFNRMTEELERADQQRRNLTADVAHELRTPLHILRGNLEGLQDGVYQPTPEHIEAMIDETQMLSRLVDDLQTLSLAEAGQLPLQLEDVDITELLADVGTSFSGPMQAAGIDFQVETEGSPRDLVVTGDVERLNQVLSNLMGNALRHTASAELSTSSEGASILLRAESTPDAVQILVHDSGEGIPTEDLPYVFDRFWRGDKSRHRRSGTGSGLGLAIAKQFVQAHGGTISVESQLGIGTTFTINFPKETRTPRQLTGRS
jgi:signal transduction histidine kinase